MGKTYATWNPADKHADITLSGSDLTFTRGSGTGANRGVRGDVPQSSGKHYFEVTVNSKNIGPYAGLATAALSLDKAAGGTAGDGSVSVYSGTLNYNGSGAGTGISFANGDIIIIAWDADAGKFWFGKNGTWYNSGNPATGANPSVSGLTGTLYPYGATYQSAESATANFGASSFAYSVPSGFNAGWHEEEAPIEIVAAPLQITAALSGRPVIGRPVPPLAAIPGLALGGTFQGRFVAAAPLTAQAALAAAWRLILVPPALIVTPGIACTPIFPPVIIRITADPLTVESVLRASWGVVWPGAPLSVAAALSVGGIASFVDRDYIVRWRCTLVPFRGALAGGLWIPGSTLPALALPMGSFQLRHTWDREEAGIAYWGSYLSAVIPGVELAGEIAARALPYDLGDGTIGRAKLRIYMVKEYRAGHEIAELIAEGDLDDVRSDVGPNSQSISISARAAASGSPKTIRLTDPQYYATYGGKKRYRVAPNLFFRCGDTALIGGDSLLAQDVTMYVGVDAGAVMEVSGT